jgi:hypothetical protein
VGGSADATIRDSAATANGEHGLVVSPSVGAPRVTVTGGEFSRNGSDGISVDPGLANEIRFSLFAASVARNDARGVLLDSARANAVLRASIAASQIAANTAFGVSFGAAAGGVAYGRISHCSVNENGNVGLLSAGTTGAVMSIKGNTVARNGVADVRQLSFAVLYTFGDNALTGNGSSDVLGSLTSRSLR